MVANDGLGSVYPGTEGHGAAVLIGRGPGLALSEKAFQIAQKEKQDREREANEMAKLASGNPLSKWTASNYNEFIPKTTELRSQFGDIMRKLDTEKDPLKKAMIRQDYKNKFEELDILAKTDSIVKDEYTKAIKAYETAPDKFDPEVEFGGKVYSVQEAQHVLADPYQVPELAAQIKEDGGVPQWRAKHWREAIPQPAYEPILDFKKQGLKLDSWVEGDLRKVGGEDLIITKSGLKPERLKTEYNAFWNRTGSLSGKRFQEHATQMAANSTSIIEDAKGNKIMTSQDPITMAAIEEMNTTEKNLNIEQQQKRLPYYYGKKEFADFHKGGETAQKIPNYWWQMNIKKTPGGGTSNKDNNTVPDYYEQGIASSLEQIRSSTTFMTPKQQFEELAKTLNLNDESGSIQVQPMAGGKYSLILPAPPQKQSSTGVPESYQFFGTNVLKMKGGVYYPVKSTESATGVLKGSPMIMLKDKNGVTTDPKDPSAIPYWQAEYENEDGDVFKVQFDLTNPDDRNFLNQKVYGGSAGMKQFDVNLKNQGKEPKVGANKPKEKRKSTVI